MIPATILKPIDYNYYKPKTKQVPHEFSFDEYFANFDYDEAMEIGYLPTIFYETAFRYAESLRLEMKRYRLSEYKRHSREIERVINDYHLALRDDSDQHTVDLLTGTIDRFKNKYNKTLLQLLFEIQRIIHSTYPDCQYLNLYTYCHAVRLLVEQGHKVQLDCDRLIEQRIGAPTTSSLNQWATLILSLATDIADKYPIKETPAVKRIMGLITYRIKQFTHILR